MTTLTLLIVAMAYWSDHANLWLRPGEHYLMQARYKNQASESNKDRFKERLAAIPFVTYI